MERLDYRDFEIEIGPGDGTHYPLAVLYSPSGQARTTMQLPFPGSRLEQQLATLEDILLTDTGEQPRQAAQAFGQQLFDALFCAEVRRVYDLSRQATAAQDQGLRTTGAWLNSWPCRARPLSYVMSSCRCPTRICL
jgi:hypothetical protein